MKKKILPSCFAYLIICMLTLQIISCKGRSSETTTTDTATITAPADNTAKKAPDTAIVISADDSLRSQLVDATKDFPGVTASVDQGIVTLTGNITRKNLPQLMKSVNALHPKKVNNNLSIK
jgi:predicted methyltransferase